MTEIDPAYLKTLRHAGRLAFGSSAIETDDDDAMVRRRFDYSFGQAVLLRAQIDMYRDGGISMHEAAAAVSNAFAYWQIQANEPDETRAALKALLESGHDDIFLCVEQHFPQGRAHYAGSLAEIVAASDATVDRRKKAAVPDLIIPKTVAEYEALFADNETALKQHQQKLKTARAHSRRGRLVLVNLSDAAETVYDRATELGIPIKANQQVRPA